MSETCKVFKGFDETFCIAHHQKVAVCRLTSENARLREAREEMVAYVVTHACRCEPCSALRSELKRDMARVDEQIDAALKGGEGGKGDRAATGNDSGLDGDKAAASPPAPANPAAPKDDEYIGGHHYPTESGTSDCSYGCGCWMGGTRSGGPDGIDPFGPCPNAPKTALSDVCPRCRHPVRWTGGEDGDWECDDPACPCDCFEWCGGEG